MRIFGIDFTSTPSRRKPITVAHGALSGTVLTIERVARVETFESFDAWLATPGPWIGGFDFPFGLPRPLVEHLQWPQGYDDLMAQVGGQTRAQLRHTFKAYCDERPAGSKFAHRACDIPAGSSPSMKWVNPPVAYMLHAGVPRLLAAGVDMPGLRPGDAKRIALEAYPGWVARRVTSASYKSDEIAKQTPARREERERIIDALMLGRVGLDVHVHLTLEQEHALAADGSGDLLDAVICAVQAAHAFRLPNFGFPPSVDPIEGWIAGIDAVQFQHPQASR